MLRFVLLRHECPPHFEKPSHWDFMLEHEGVLRSWEMRKLPTAWAVLLGEATEKSTVTAIPLPDHRLAYLDYEGPVSGDRGSVRSVDRGTYEPIQETQGKESQEVLTVALRGELLRGTVCLRCQESGWTLTAIDEA